MNPQLPKKKQFGNWSESYAASFLIKKGYSILHRNYRFKHSEIDLITKHKNTIIFVEVKARTSTFFGYPEETVSKNQKNAIKRAAMAYLESNNLDLEIRVDIVSILKRGKQIEVYHAEDAFY